MTVIKKALVLPGGQWQVPLIKYLKEKDYHVTVIDPYINSPGVALADSHLVFDVLNIDFDAIEDKFDLVLTDQSDIAVMPSQEIARKLKLKSNPHDAIELFTNKYASRHFARSLGIPVPEFSIIQNVDQARLFYNKLKNDKFIIKPVDSQSSRGIAFIYKEEDIQEKIVNSALSFSSEKYVIMEELLEGIEITAEGICIDTKHTTLVTSRKTHIKPGIAKSLTYPADIPDEIRDLIIYYNNLYVNSSSLDYGITHSEYFYNPTSKEVWLIEIACRGGGSLISSHIVPHTTGVHIYDLLIEYLANGVETPITANFPLKSALLYFFEFQGGLVESIHGIDDIRRYNFVADFQLSFSVGDTIKSATDDRSRQGFVLILGECSDDLLDKLALIESKLVVEIKS